MARAKKAAVTPEAVLKAAQADGSFKVETASGKNAHLSIPLGWFDSEGNWSPVSTSELTAVGRLRKYEKKVGADGNNVSIRAQVENVLSEDLMQVISDALHGSEIGQQIQQARSDRAEAESKRIEARNNAMAKNAEAVTNVANRLAARAMLEQGVDISVIEKVYGSEIAASLTEE